MKYQITHKTAYGYSSPASLSQNELFLTPKNTASQEVLESELIIEPKPQYLHSREDYFGNLVHIFMVQHPHDELAVTIRSMVEAREPVLPVPDETMPWEEVVTRLREKRTPYELEASQYCFASPLVPLLEEAVEYGSTSFKPNTPVLKGAMELMSRIYTEFSYDKAASNVDTPTEQVLINRKGVCQDFAHVAISCLRGLGLPARYVSGYLETIPPSGKPRLVGADASHAWFAVYVPDFGWVDLDPTNNKPASDQYITVAWGRDYGDVAPVKGVVMGGGIHDLSVMVDVAPQE